MAGQATSAVEIARRSLIGDGSTDDGPAIQAVYDAGGQSLDLDSNRPYLNTPVFFDNKDTYSMFVINMNGAEFKLGPDLPTTDAFWRDETVKWAFFPNTKRSALSGGKVTVTTSTRATGTSVGALLTLNVRNGTIDGDSKNAGLVFANRTGTRFDSVVLWRGRALLSWFDYSDINVFIACHNRAGGPTNSVLIEQIASGDGLTMTSCKSDASVGLARLKYCRGGAITSTVTGLVELDSCSAVVIGSAHQEAPIVNKTILIVRNSPVTVDSSVFYVTRGDRPEHQAAITGRRLENGRSQRDHPQQCHRDACPTRMPTSRWGRPPGRDRRGRVHHDQRRQDDRCDHIARQRRIWSSTAGPTFTSSGDVQAALDAGRATVASGDFVLSRRNGAWQVAGTGPVPAGAPIEPEVLSLTGGSDDVKNGTLPRVTPLGYRLQVRTADGSTSRVIAKQRTVAGANRTVKLDLRLPVPHAKSSSGAIRSRPGARRHSPSFRAVAPRCPL